MNKTIPENNKKHWYLGKWPILAWLETFIKVLALAIGFFALTNAFRSDAQLAFPEGVKLAQFTIQAMLTLGLIAAIFDRIQEREIIAMIFLILNNLGHIGILSALLNPFFQSNLLISFWILMLLGDVTKVFFLRFHKFSVRNASPAVMYGLTSFYLLGYLALILIQLLG